MNRKPEHNWWSKRSRDNEATGKPSGKHPAQSFNRTFVRRSVPKPWKHGVI